jgi:hypothetical protein
LANYRLYRIDGAGKITSAEWLEASDDEDAAKLARERAPDGIAEVWERNRLVTRLNRGEQSAGD